MPKGNGWPSKSLKGSAKMTEVKGHSKKGGKKAAKKSAKKAAKKK
jgi:hypothetical protein